MVQFGKDKLSIHLTGVGDPFHTYVQLTNALFVALCILADEKENDEVTKKAISTLSYYLGQALTEFGESDLMDIENSLKL